MRSPIFASLLACLVAAPLLASDYPTVKQPLSDLSVAQGGGLPTIDLRNHFEISGIQQTVVQFRCVLGAFNLEMRPDAAPISVTNFLRYINEGKLVNHAVHRSDTNLGVIQGGEFTVTTTNMDRVPTYTSIPLEYNLPNERGTIAMARTSAPDSATCQYFINTSNNTVNLGAWNGGGYAVFGRVTGSGMSVVDAIATVPTYRWGAYPTWPLIGWAGGTNDVFYTNIIAMSVAQVVPLFPTTNGEPAVAGFTVTNTNPSLLAAAIEGSLLRLTPKAGQSGGALITVTATDINGNATQTSFQVTIAPPVPVSVVSDVDGDGIDDVLWQDEASTSVGAWLMPSKAWLWVSPGNNGAWKLVGMADVNGDGRLDVVWQNSSTTEVGAWLMPTKEWRWVAAGSNGAWRVVSTGDVNGDGKLDLVWQNTLTTEVGAWLMPYGTWTWLAPGNNGAWKVVAVADVNADGTSDLVWQNSTGTEVGAWLLPAKTWHWVAAGNNGSWRVVGAADVDQDGKSDLLWQNAATTEVGAWLMPSGMARPWPSAGSKRSHCSPSSVGGCSTLRWVSQTRAPRAAAARAKRWPV